MRIMSERRFREELERAKSEVYQQERLDKMYHELSGRMDVIQRDLFDLRCKVLYRKIDVLEAKVYCIQHGIVPKEDA